MQKNHMQAIAREENVANLTRINVPGSVLNHFYQKKQLIKCGENTYKLDVEREIYMRAVDLYGI